MEGNAVSMAYIRRFYGVPAKRGMRVVWDTRTGSRYGTITSASCYVRVRFDDQPAHPVPLHPMEEGLRYLEPDPDENEHDGDGAQPWED